MPRTSVSMCSLGKPWYNGGLQVAAINAAMSSLVKTLNVFPKERTIVQRERAKVPPSGLCLTRHRDTSICVAVQALLWYGWNAETRHDMVRAR